MPGLLYHSAATVIKYLLIGAGHGSASLSGDSWPIFVGNEPSTPDEVITLYARNLFHKGKDHRGEVSEFYGLDLRLRASEYALGDYKILSIKDYLDKVNNVRVDVPSMTSVGVVVPGATYSVANFTRTGTYRGTTHYLHLGKERSQTSGTDIVPVSQREIFTFSGKVNLRMI